MIDKDIQIFKERTIERKYYAHSENSYNKKHNLLDHLKNVAKIMESFSCKEEYKSMLYLAGLLHDFGKYQLEFQNYLENGGKRGSVPHSSWGAGYTRILGLNEISFTIDGHHKGLPDRSNWKIDTNEFKIGEVENFEKIKKEFLNECGKSENDLKITSVKFSNKSETELFIRYVFSCLTDADWLDTEAHFNDIKSETRRMVKLDIEGMIFQLSNYLKQKSKDGEINQLRNKIREEVIKKANKPSGFYTLNLPTGLGKTLTSISWALEHAKYNKIKRIIIVLPFINIIDQTAQILKNIFGENSVLEHHSNIVEDDCVKDETDFFDYKKLACENWDYPIIVTTSVQFFESLFSRKPSKVRKIHNIADSVVIFDEIQTLKKELVSPTLKMLKDIQHLMQTSFLFCTATMPTFEKREKFESGIEKIESLVDDTKSLFELDCIKRVVYQIIDDFNGITLKQLFGKVLNINQSTLIVFNTKKDAKSFYKEVEINNSNWEKIYHLSTLMCPVHRKKIIKEISEDLKSKKKILVSSTQLIEAGVDFDFPVVFRALAPLESIIQAAGRCNREGKIIEKGKVFLFYLTNSKMPDKTYEACARHAGLLIKENLNDLYKYELFGNYYKQTIDLFVDSDKYQINQARENFNFKIVDNSYHLIDSKTEAVFIKYYDETSEKLFNKIEAKGFVSKLDYKKIQQYCVQLYSSDFIKLYGFYELSKVGLKIWKGIYDENIGLFNESLEKQILIT